MASDLVALPALYKEGARSRPISVSVTATKQGLEIRDPVDNILLTQWGYDDLRFVETKHGHRLLRSVTDEDARLSQPSPELTKILRRRARQLKLGPALPHVNLRLVIIAAVLLLLSGLFYGLLPTMGRSQVDRFPESWGTRWGDIISANLLKTEASCTGAEGLAGLQEVMARLNQTQSLPTWRLAVVKSRHKESIALPGNTILVTDTQLRSLRSAGELAALIAHELGHAQRRAPMERALDQVGMTLLFRSLIGGDLRVTLAGLTHGDFDDLHSAEAETAADALGVALLDRAGIDTAAVNAMAENLGGHRYAAWAKAHPPGTARARAQGSPLNTTPLLDDDSWSAIRRICDGTP